MRTVFGDTPLYAAISSTVFPLARLRATRASVPRFAVLFELRVSDHSQAYVPICREIEAQFEVCKTLILLGNSDFGRPYFEPGGRRFDKPAQAPG